MQPHKTINVHGLGFIQYELPGNQRMHVWHPGIKPRINAHRSLHSHSFGFESTILNGMLINEIHNTYTTNPGTYDAYSHDGERLPSGQRPWTLLDDQRNSEVRTTTTYGPSDQYVMHPGVFHKTRTSPFCVTLLRKTAETDTPAITLHEHAFTNQEDYDRFAVPEHILWQMVREAMEHRT